jgi:glycosyltransferase involved in cell wall biosynthesis
MNYIRRMKPIFSIITVVFNGETLIDLTMQSVLNQSFTQYEYIVIDGLSKDGTVGVIKQYFEQHPLSIQWISEKDKGLYDAMNKGLRMAKGDFILFLNAGDTLFNSEVLAKMAAQITPKTDVLYGETMLVDDARTHIGTRTEMTVQKLPEKLTWQDMNRGMVVCHQAFLPARHLTPQYMPNNLAADIDWVIKCLQKADNVVNTHIVISEYLMGGMSKQRHKQSLKDRYDILKTHFGFLPNLVNHVGILWRAFWFKIFNKKGY